MAVKTPSPPHKAKNPGKFQHTVREIATLKRAHSAMMANINAGLIYDVVKREWVKTNACDDCKGEIDDDEQG